MALIGEETIMFLWGTTTQSFCGSCRLCLIARNMLTTFNNATCNKAIASFHPKLRSDGLVESWLDLTRSDFDYFQCKFFCGNSFDCSLFVSKYLNVDTRFDLFWLSRLLRDTPVDQWPLISITFYILSNRHDFSQWMTKVSTGMWTSGSVLIST